MIAWEQEICIRRIGQGSYNEGEWQEGEVQDFDAKANVQPQQFTRTLSETYGERLTSAIKIYTNEELRLNREGQKADLVKYENDWYEIVEVRKYTQLRLKHFHAIAMRINREDQEEQDG